MSTWRPFRIQIDIDVHLWVCASDEGAPGLVDGILQKAFDAYKVNAFPPCLELPPKTRRKELLVNLPDATLKDLSLWAKRHKMWGTNIARSLLQMAYEKDMRSRRRAGNSSTDPSSIATMGDGED